MYEKNEKKSISNLCAPTSKLAPEHPQQQEQPCVWSLTQMGVGIADKDEIQIIEEPLPLAAENDDQFPKIKQ